MKKKYNFTYDMNEVDISFIVDTEVFTADVAKETLKFFAWDYDRENDPVDEVMKKYAMEVIEVATFNDYNSYGVIDEFDDREGFCKLDGSMGILLVHSESYVFDEDKLSCEIKELNEDI